MRTRPRTRNLRRLQPLALASLLALSANSLNAAPRTFTGGSSFWDVLANWSGGVLPGVGDDALLGAFNTEIRTSFTLNSLVGTGALTVSAGSVSFAAASSIGALNLTGGTLAGTGSLQVAGPSTWTHGTMSGTGATTFGGDLVLSGNGLRDITNGRSVNFNGTTTWNNAAVSQGRIRTGSSATLNNNGTWLDQNNFGNQISQDLGGPASTFVNAGTYTKTGSATTTIAIRFDNTFTGVSGGAVNVNAGALLLTGGGTSNGSFAGLAGTTIGFGAHTLQAGSIVSSFGAVEFSGGIGNNTVAGGYNVAGGTSFTSGTTTFTGTIAAVGAALVANGGTGVFNNAQALGVSSLVISNGGGLVFNNAGGVVTDGLSLNIGTLGGTSEVIVNGASSWGSGTMTGSGTTTLNTDLALSGNGLRDITNGRSVNFNGTTTWNNAAVSQGRIRTGSSATLNNNGTWLDQNNFGNQISQDFGGPASTFVNNGIYTKSGAATTNIAIAFNNTHSGAGTGVVNVDAGTLLLSGGGTSNGSFAGAGLLEFGGGTHTLQAASSINNPNVVFSGSTTTLAGLYNASGSTTIGSGTANFTGTVANSGGALVLNGGGVANFSNSAGVQFASLNLQSGTIGGTQAVTFTGPSTWAAGTMTGAGTTTFAGDVALSGNGLKDITSGRSVNFNGTTTWTNASAGQGRIRTGSSATLNNNGSWLDQNSFANSISQDFGGPTSTFVNAGSYTKSGPGTTNLAIAFNNTRSGAGTGVVDVNAGTLQLGGGGTSNGSFAGAGTLDFSGGTHTLLAASSVANNNVTFSGSTATLAGTYNVSGTTAFTGGTAHFTGTVANSGGALTFSTNGGSANFSNSAGVQFASLNMEGGTIGGTQAVSFNGPSTWVTGSMTGAGTTTFAGDVALGGNGLKDITNGRSVNFYGTTTWANLSASQGRIRTGSSATLNNNGSWLDQNNFANSISQDFGGPTSTFVNNGIYTKSGTGTSNLAIAFNNTRSGAGTGVVNVNAGTLQLGGGGTSNGSFAGAGTLDFSGGTHTLLAASSVANPNVTFSGGNTTLAGTYSASGTTAFTGGTANFTGTAAHSGGALTFSTNGGSANFSSSAGAQFATLNMQSGTIGGTQTVTFTGPSVWATGTMTGAGSTTFTGDVALSGNGLKDITSGRSVNFNGTTTWANLGANQGRIRTGSSATLSNNGNWLDQNTFANQISPDFGGPASTFVNAGTYTKSGNATTALFIGFDNAASGTVNLNSGSLQLSAGSSSSGAIAVANGATLDFNGGSHTLGGSLAGVAGARVLTNSGTVTNTNAKNFGGLLEVANGSFISDAAFTAATYLQSAGIMGGAGAFTVSGAATWTAGSMTGAGSTTFAGDLALSGNGLKDITSGRSVNFNGTTTWTNASAGQGRIRTGSSATLNNNGSWLDQSTFANGISPDFGGPASAFTNAGSYTKSGASTTNIAIAFNNTGTVNADAGTLTLTGGLNNFSGTTLTGGSFNVSGAGIFSFTGANVVTNAAGIRLDGAGSQFLNASGGSNGLANLAANTAAGSFTLRNGRNFTTVGTFNNAGIVNVGPSSTFTGGGAFTNQSTGQLQMAGGSFSGPSLANTGTVSGFGAVAPVVSNSGTVRAAGGTLALNGGTLGATGMVIVDTGATLSLGATSSARNLVHNGTLLALGTSNITVFNDYDNAGFGVGNGFNRRGGVSGAGQILASGTAQQTLSGALVSGGSTAAATLALPNIRVGQGGFSTSFTISNTGVGGPSLRGALVTTGLGNAGLSGSGVTAQNWGAISQFDPGQTFTISFDPSFGQALSGQVLQVVNNFDNVAGQTLGFTGQAFNVASASAATPNPVVFANQRVGGTLSQTLMIRNTAPDSGFSESLNATIAAGGTATAGGSFSLLAAGASNSALFVGVNTGSAGAKSGIATISLASDGTGTSGFSALALASQNVAVSGNVYRVAQASTVTPGTVLLGNVRAGGVLTRALSLSNLAAADGFSESLNASIGGSSGILTGGSFTGLAAGASSNSLFVGIDTSAPGLRNGTATITLASNGSGSSGLAAFDLGTQTVNVSATIYRLASASNATPNPVLLADQRIGGSLAQALSLSNTAAPDSFSERLGATISASGSATAGGTFNLLAAGATSSALFVGVDTSTAGAKSGTATIHLTSDGTGTSGFSGLAIASQNVAVAGNVFRLAVPVVSTAPVTLVGRVGDTLSAAQINVTNNAPDLFTERLNASITSAPTGLSSGPALLGLAPNASGNLALSLATTTAGNFSGTAGVGLVSSSAGTTSGAPDIDLGTVNVAVNARVYAPAVAQLPVTVVNFGTVRVGDSVAARPVAVGNTAAGALTDTLSATFGGGNAPFTASGSVVGVAAGSSNASALQVQLNTATAGVFNGTASVALQSQNPELADLTLAPVGITLQAQVNNLATATLAQAGGSGTFSGTTLNYTLDFGTVFTDASSLSGSLSLANAASGTADALAGSWSLAALAGGPFSVAGFEAFTGLVAGGQLAGLTVSFDLGTEGSFSRTVVLNSLSTNGSGPDLALGPISLRLQGTVVAIPEPGTYLMMAVGVLVMGSIARRKLRARQG